MPSDDDYPDDNVPRSALLLNVLCDDVYHDVLLHDDVLLPIHV